MARALPRPNSTTGGRLWSLTVAVMVALGPALAVAQPAPDPAPPAPDTKGVHVDPDTGKLMVPLVKMPDVKSVPASPAQHDARNAAPPVSLQPTPPPSGAPTVVIPPATKPNNFGPGSRAPLGTAPTPPNAAPPAPGPGPGAAPLPTPDPSKIPAAPNPTAAPATTLAKRAVTTSADELVTVRTELKPDPSNIGDLLTLEVVAAYANGVTVNLPMGLDFTPLHVVEVSESEPESTGTGFRKVFTIKLQYFNTGDATVPAFPLTYLDAEGGVQTVQIAPTPFVVDSLLANENDPEREPEDPPISLEYPNDRAELVIYSAIAALIVGFLGMLLWNRWRRRPRAELLPPPVPAHEVALSALTELEQAGYLKEERYQDYYLELTEIAKGYLEGRFGIEALDRTTDEIRADLRRVGERIQPLEPGDVLRFLERADLVKFARLAPAEDEAKDALGEVRGMVTSTLPAEKPEPVPEPAPAGDGEASAEAETPEPDSGSDSDKEANA